MREGVREGVREDMYKGVGWEENVIERRRRTSIDEGVRENK